jgi:diguanylate cyclase (GGDEF)-like protein/PAS domain S-box-containing protein
MTSARTKDAASRIVLALLPWLVLSVTLGVTWFASEHERQAAQKALRTQFDFALRETVSRVEQRVQGYEQMLRGVQSLFATTSLKNRAAMHDYVETLQLDANFAGIQAIGLVEWVPAQRRPEHLAAMRNAGFLDYAIDPAGQREVYAPIVQREPYVGRNRAPPGNDVWFDPVRRLAIEKSRDSGAASITGKVRLKIDTEADAAPGFIMYLPVYAQGQEHGSVGHRRDQLIGWVYAAFHMNDFMASLYGSQSPGLALAMYDGTEVADASLLYRAGDSSTGPLHQGAVSANEYMVVAGHNWTLSLSTQEAFEALYGRGTASVTALAGTLLSLLLAVLTWLMVNGRDRALRLAAAMTQELRASEQRFNRAVNGAQEGIWELDLLTNELYHSPRMAQMLGYTEIEMPARREAWDAITNPDDLAQFHTEADKHLKDAGHPFDVLLRMLHRDGSWRWMQSRGTALRDAQGQTLLFSGTHLDVTERKRLEEDVRQLAFYDPLTNLPNRRLFHDRLRQTLARAKRAQSRMALMFIDLDKFKPINDEHGHEAGDWLLQSVARRIESCLRASDTAARVGGDEFLVLLPDVNNGDDALAVAEKIRMELERPFVTPSQLSLRASSSIGIAIYPDHANTEEDLMRLGDRAMYQAKRLGGNLVQLCALGSESEDMDDAGAAGQSLTPLTWKAPEYCPGQATACGLR